MRTTTTRPQTKKNLTAEQRRRAERLTSRLTAFPNFAALLSYYAPIGGYRANLRPTSPALLARWTDADRRADRSEWDLRLNLAHLADLAEAQPGRQVVVRPAARRAA